MKHFIKLILIFIPVLGVTLWAVLFFYNDGCYFNLTHAEFSHFVAPVATLLSVFLLIYTLAETKRFNENQLALNEYNVYREEISQFREELMNLRFIGEKSKKIFSDEMIEHLEKSNGLDYIEALSYFLKFELRNSNNEAAKKEMEFKRCLFRPLSFIYERIYHLIFEINHNQVLSGNYKAKLYARIESDLLVPYLVLFNSKHLDLDLSKIETTNKFFSIEFKKMNDYVFKHGVNKVHSKKYYQEKL